MILTIGMIVKNEEKYLDECLTAIKPILDNLRSELIIVDTGSTDKTVEIAKKYTNNIHYFEWCNDFAAARNVTIDHAKGEWYMFIDADEILKDASEIIKFFKSKEYKKYMSAAHFISNYNNYQKTSSASVLIPRMRKMTGKIRFSGIVHEQLPFILPVKNLTKTEFIHYGYLLPNPKQAKAKSKRNVDLLLKQLDTIPDSSKLRRELGEAYMLHDTAKNREEALKHYKIGKELAIKENNNYYCVIAINLIAHYIRMGCYIDALNESELYFKAKSDPLASDTDVYFFMLQAYTSLNKYESSVETYLNYVENYEKYMDNKVITREIYARAIFSIDKLSYYKASLFVISSYMKLEQYNYAYDLINKILPLSCEFIENQDLLFKHYLELTKYKHNYNDIINLYYSDIEKNKEFKENLEKTIEVFINENNDEKDNIETLFSKFDSQEDPYIKYMILRQKYKSNPKDVEELIIELLAQLKKLEVYHYDIVYYILKNKLSLDLIKDTLNVSILPLLFDLLYKQYNDFFDVLSSYTHETSSPYEAYILKTIYEISLNYAKDEDKELLMNIFSKYIQNFETYISHTYNMEIFNDDNIYLLPNDIKFGYYCSKANYALESSDTLNYIKLLRKALDSNNSMNDLISLLTESVTIPDEQDDSNNLSEFEILALTVKKNIYDLIELNNLNEAQSILAEYKTLNPNDPEIIKLENILYKA